MDALWKMLENAILGGNWIVVVIVGAVIVAYIYFTNKNNVTADVVDAVAALKVQLDANSAADVELREKVTENDIILHKRLDVNDENDDALKARVSHIEEMISEMYTPVTGKPIEENESSE